MQTMKKIGDDTNNTTSNSTTSNSNQGTLDFSRVASIEGDDANGYYIRVPKEILEKIESKLKEKGVRPRDLGLRNFKCFKDFIAAEIKTQFPDLGNTNLTSDNGDIVTNGCIKIRRAKIDNNNESQVTDLKYTTKENFEEMCDKNDINALNYFTLDENGKLIVASDSYTKVSVSTSGDTSIPDDIAQSKEESTVSELSPIDYRPAVARYSLPFTFMLDILATSGGKDLALGIASLADTTELEITIETTVQENHTEENYKYTKKEEGKKKFSYSIYEKHSYKSMRPVSKLLESKTTSVDASPEEKECTVKVVTDTRYNSCNIELTKADCWIAKAEKVYEPADVENTSSGPTTTELGEVKEDAVKENYDIDTDTDVQSFIDGRIAYWKKQIASDTQAGTKKVEIIASKSNLDVSDLSITTNCTQTTSSSSTKRKYNVTTSEIVSNEDKVFEIFNKNKKSFYKMKDAQEFLYEELEENSLTVNFADIMRYLINKFKNPNYQGELDLSAFELPTFRTAGGGGASVFGCNLSRDEFIAAATSYNSTNASYQPYMAANAGNFYDICTSSEYNINPCFAYAHACLETGWGSSPDCRNLNNFFGYGHYNTSSSGTRFSSPSESIKAYCDWIIKCSTPGNSSYAMCEERGTLYAGYNESFTGNPSENVYDIFSTYAYLGDTHITSDSEYTTTWGIRRKNIYKSYIWWV